MTPKEKALKLCQDMAHTSMKTDFNEGYTLPLDIAKKCALVAVEACFEESYKQATEISIWSQDFWQEVKTEIEKL